MSTFRSATVVMVLPGARIVTRAEVEKPKSSRWTAEVRNLWRSPAAWQFLTVAAGRVEGGLDRAILDRMADTR